ncbi:MAG TPA: hypothetical protein VGE07_26425 [Herpetosiphonaceae bacterium]
MGFSWLQVAIPDDLDRAELGRLIDEQARVSSRYAAICEDTDEFPLASAPAFGERFTTLSTACGERALALSAALAIDFNATPDDWRSTYPISRSFLLPPEWRHAAHRSFLPDELARGIAAWRGYLAAVERGRYAAYVERLYLYLRASRLYWKWLAMRRIAGEALDRTNAWMTRHNLRQLASLMLQIPPPAMPAKPLWAFWQARPDAAPEPDIELGLAQLDQLQIELAALSREWDCRVPRSHKIHIFPDPLDFESFMEDASDERLLELIGWLEEGALAGLVCYLDG